MTFTITLTGETNSGNEKLLRCPVVGEKAEDLEDEEEEEAAPLRAVGQYRA